MQISDQKCEEYTKLTKVSVHIGPRMPNAQTHEFEIENCTIVRGSIVDGLDAKIGEFPHMAAIGYLDANNEISFGSSGSLISERFVLTAAHCKILNRVTASVVRLGDLNLKIKESILPELDISIESFITHENFDPKTHKNDIAVVKLARAVIFSEYIRPACIMTKNLETDKKVTATGWGVSDLFVQRNSDVLQKVDLDVIDYGVCNSLLEDYDRIIDGSQICAGVLEGGKDTCTGDSGGPLQIKSKDNKCIFIIAGITSYSVSFCGSENSPSIYTNVSAYSDWIEDNVWNHK